jgi:U6 snRNA-associated Sm-like protein LSm6
MQATDADTAADTASKNKRSPSDFLKSVLGRPVRVKLNSGIEYRGVLACLDGYMNIAMEQTEEYVDDQLKAKYGDCFIRGNNGTSQELFSSPHNHVAFCLFEFVLSSFSSNPQCYTFRHKQNEGRLMFI